MNTLSPAGSQLDHTLLAVFLEKVPDFVYFKDRESRFLSLSASLVKYFGCENSDEVIGKSDFDFFSKAHAQPAFDDEQRIIATGEGIVGKLEKETWQDGHVTYVLTSKVPLRDKEGKIIGTFGISKDVTSSKEMEQDLEKTRRELMDASRIAGMAEVATGVLHNVGNVLNSLNVSASVIADGLRNSKTERLKDLADLLSQHSADLGKFLTEDPKGKTAMKFLDSLATHFSAENKRLLQEIESLLKNVDHIKEIVTMQQAYATTIGVVEPHDAAALMEDAVRMNAGALLRHEVTLVRDFKPVPYVLAEKGKVLQILINLIRNSKYACDERGHVDKRITLRIEPGPNETVRLIVEDNGVGIPPENMPRIYEHGFTTRAHGHGFGLHSSALAARDMKGTLLARSDGMDKGAIFTLELPIAKAGAEAETSR